MECSDQQAEDTENQVVNSLKEMLKTVSPLQSECSIYKIPEEIRCVNEKAFVPKIVSIGPMHHDKEKLHTMETHKNRYLNDFLKRNQDVKLEDYVKMLKGVEERARNCYAENICIRSNDFVKMMVLDGCFIIELFLKYVIYSELRNKDDPIIENRFIRNYMIYDMFLLENQLPFFVLEYLFNLFNGPEKKYTGYSFLELTLHYFEKQVKRGQDVLLRRSNYQVKHFVDLLLYCYLPTEVRMRPKGEGRRFVFIPSATELLEAGVKFKIGTGNCFLDVKFSNGVLEIPTLIVEGKTETIFRNLIAMEQCRNGSSTYFTDYILLMDCLINTPTDVALLRSRGIIDNWMSDNEAVSGLFNKLCKGTLTTSWTFYYHRLFEDVNGYYNIRWNVWKAKLKRDYFNNPWAILSLIAAVILLICTFIQTICSLI